MSELRTIHDTETYPNVFLLGAATVSKPNNYYIFEISSRKNEYNKLMQFLSLHIRKKIRMVGFNNQLYDYSLLHQLIVTDYSNSPAELINEHIYELSSKIIEDDDPYAYSHWESDMHIPQMDLFKIHHYDNKAKSTSLKMLEFNNKLQTIEELPFPPGTVLTNDEIDYLISYLKHDIKATHDEYTRSTEAIKLREELSLKFNRDFTNYNDTRIGSAMIQIELEKHLGKGCCYAKTANGKVKKQTFRKEIKIGDILFPYLKYNSEPMRAIHRFFYNWVLRKREGVDSITKEVFKNIPVNELGLLVDHMEKTYSKTELRRKAVRDRIQQFNADSIPQHTKPKDWRLLRDHMIPDINTNDDYSKMGAYSLRYLKAYATNENLDEPEHKMTGKIDNLNIVHKGFKFVFGTGGIHGSVSNESFYSRDGFVICDFDFEGYYPAMAEANNMSPAQYPAEIWVKAQKILGAERKKYKKGTGLNLTYKLARNAAYGKSNDIHSFFYDPSYTMQTCINGQLILCVIAERLMELPESRLIQINTDGLTMHLRKSDVQEAIRLCKEWDAVTGLHMEGDAYKEMHVGDVNNYLAVDFKGKTKEKGRYATKRLPHQNHSALVIPKAAKEFLTKGTPVRKFITEHQDYFDFMLRTKLQKTSTLLGVDSNGVAKTLQRITRYCVSTEGVSLIKRMPTTDKEREKDPEKLMKDTGIESGWVVQDCNNMANFNPDLINYEYYIERAEKLIKMEVDWDDE